MQVTLYSEDFRQGLTRDWPFVPRLGDLIEMTLPGGVDRKIVDEVVLYVGDDGSFHSASVSLSYGDSTKTFFHAPPIS